MPKTKEAASSSHRHHHHHHKAEDEKKSSSSRHHRHLSPKSSSRIAGLVDLLTNLATVTHGKKTKDVRMPRTDLIGLSRSQKFVEHMTQSIAETCASGCRDWNCQNSGICRHIATIDDGFRKLCAMHNFYTLDFIQYANVPIITNIVLPIIGVTQYAYLNTDGSVNIVTYTGVAPVQPNNTTVITFQYGTGLSNQTQLGDLVIIDGVTDAAGTSLGTSALAAHLFNSKYYVSVNAPAGTYTLTPLSVDDMQVNDLVQITNYFDVSVNPVASPGVNQVVQLNAVDYYTQTTSYTVTPWASNVNVRSIRAGYVDNDGSCGGNNHVCSRKTFCLDTPMSLYLRNDDALLNSGAFDVSRLSEGMVDLLAKSPEDRRHESHGLRWNPKTHNIERGNSDDYLDMTHRDVARYLKKKLMPMHHNILVSFDMVGGVASFV